MARQAHITIGGDPLCERSGSVAWISLQEKLGAPVVTCDYLSTRAALAAAQRLRPYFRRGLVRVAPGPCPIR